MSWTDKLEKQFMEVFNECVFSLPTASENAFNKEENHEQPNNQQFIQQDDRPFSKTQGSRSQS